jgi:hypothetical protein
MIADVAGLRAAYVVPLLAYACISTFAIAAGRAAPVNSGATTSAAH